MQAAAAQPTTDPAPHSEARRQLFLVCASDFVVWLGAGAIFPYLPVFLQEQAHASLALIGVIASAYFAGIFAFSSPFGRFSDRIGRKPMIVFGTLLYAVATLLFIATTEPFWFVVFRFIEGMGAAAVVPAGQAFIAEITDDEHRSRAYGWLTSAQFGGFIVGPALAWPLYALGGGEGKWAFYSIFLFGSAIVFVTAAALTLLLREPERGRRLREERAEAPPYRALLTRPVAAILLVVATAEFAQGGWEVLWSIWLRSIGAPMAYIGLTWAAFSAPMLLSWFGGHLADRYSRFVLMVAGFGVLGVIWGSFSFTHDLALYMVLLLIGGLALAFAFPAKQAFLVQVSPSRWLGTIQGMEQTAMQLAAFIGTLTAPLIYGAFHGYFFVVGGAVALLGLAVAFSTLRREWACVADRGVMSCAEAERLAAGANPAASSTTEEE